MIREAIVAVEGEPGDDGTAWTLREMEVLCRRIREETDGWAWFERDARGRAVLFARGNDGGGGQVRAALREDGHDGDRIAEARRRRSAKAERRIAQARASGIARDAVPASGEAPAVSGGFKVRTYHGNR